MMCLPRNIPKVSYTQASEFIRILGHNIKSTPQKQNFQEKSFNCFEREHMQDLTHIAFTPVTRDV